MCQGDAKFAASCLVSIRFDGQEEPADSASASYDILRLYDLKEPPSSRSTVPFLIVPGHRTGVVSQLYMDPACRFMISTGGNRGWEGASTEVLLGYEINAVP